MKIASWNVNSIKARLEHVIKLLETQQPDVLMIQELKGLDFPAETLKALGYNTEAVTQKAYNGVALITKSEIEVLHTKLPGFEEDEQARYIEANIDKPKEQIRLINIYLPNGNPVGTEKFDYKIKWMEHLKTHLQNLRNEEVNFIIGGDFNVIPEDKDCHDPAAWKEDALRQPKTLNAFRSLEYLGLYDAYRINDKSAEKYTFWDYQAGAWQKDNGLRIDHFLLCPHLVDKLISCTINKEPRSWERPSDHTPITIEIAA